MSEEVQVAEVQEAPKTLVDTKYVDMKLVDGKIQLVIELDAKSEVEKLADKAENKYLKAALNALKDLL